MRILFIALLGFLACSLKPLAFAADISSFKSHKIIEISGAGVELFNYPVKLRLVKGRNGQKDLSSSARADDIYITGEVDGSFKDIRFVEDVSREFLDYYLERVFSGESFIYADFWVKIPRIPKEGLKIYLYYGNKDAVSLSYPEAVFPFFEDFENPVLNEEKWSLVSALNKEFIINQGNLELKDCTLISRGFRIKEGILEFRAKAAKFAAIQAIVRGKEVVRSAFPFEEILYSSAYPGAEHTIAVNGVAKLNIAKPVTSDVYYIYRATLNSQETIFERYSSNYEKEAQIQFFEQGLSGEGYIGLKAEGSSFGAGSVYFDWVRVRPYSFFEPKAQEYK